MTVHVVGNACIDTTFRVAHFPAPGETLDALSSDEGLGGKGLNQAVAARRTGAHVRFHAAVGRDAAAMRIREGLRAETMDDGDLVEVDQPTDRSVVMVDRDGENRIVSITNCARIFLPAATAAFAASLASGDLLVLQGNLTAEATIACLAQGRAAGALTVFNPSPMTEAIRVPLTLVDLLVVNTPEAATLAGIPNAAMAVRALRDAGARGVIVTEGAEGAIFADASGLPVFRPRRWWWPTPVVPGTFSAECSPG
ncbi:PfkB family carbohydrate kinase [Methylobrevis pamukkalensis]|uniref:Ribokinase n=1 Tax=Methylobrevis pamukkalensis TaxID=1439726 RepID=A0A1E3H3W3_9HYPH|nr:PfkB family carbohydrate kinase [Methylobrevis pamukkalensis]ODN70476.1 Ribokinase [Methylobrevis pamukkalensis]